MIPTEWVTHLAFVHYPEQPVRFSIVKMLKLKLKSVHPTLVYIASLWSSYIVCGL